jgi:hypothetical protein
MWKRWIVIGALLLAGVGVSDAQDNPLSPALAEQMSTLEQITSKLRGLSIEQQLGHEFPTRQQTIDYLRANYDKDMTPEETDHLQAFYVALGLLPADTDLRAVYLGLLDSQVAGFYDPATKVMNVIPMKGGSPGDSLSFTEQIIYIHEFTHALQDQHFDLNSLLSAEQDIQTPDRSLAITSLVEGDATSIMTLYSQEATLRNPLLALSMLVEGLQAGNLFLPPDVPAALVNELTFPYTQGMNFVVAVFSHGGWDAVNAAFANPPTTSEQIMHPDKYIAGEGAQTVAAPDASAKLGPGWQPVWDSTLGEFYLSEYLATELTGNHAATAAAGWGGDHLRIYRDADGKLAFALHLAWDTPADQQEFAEQYAQFGDKMFGGMADGSCWHNADHALCHVTASDGTDLITSAPTLELAQTVGGG